MSLHPVLKRLASAALLLAAFVPAGTAFGQTAGRIDVLNNRGEVSPLAGATVVSETLDEVRFTRTGSERTENRPADRVVFIDYGPGSAAYSGAQAALKTGDLQNAVNLFSAAVNDKTPAWVSAHALLGLAEARAEQGQAADARAAVQRFLDEQTNHRLTPRALLISAHLAAQAGDPGRAQSDVDKVLALASSGKLTPDWAVRAHLAHGQDLLDAGDSDAARTAFTAAETASRTGASNLGAREDLADELGRLALAARSGMGSAILASGDLQGARSFFDTLERDGGDNSAIRVAALNGKAEADFLDDGRLKEAQLGFARAAVLGASIADEHAKALYYLGRCCEALGQQDAEPNARSRAHQYYKDVDRRYPSTRWARLARELLP